MIETANTSSFTMESPLSLGQKSRIAFGGGKKEKWTEEGRREGVLRALVLTHSTRQECNYVQGEQHGLGWQLQPWQSDSASGMMALFAGQSLKRKAARAKQQSSTVHNDPCSDSVHCVRQTHLSWAPPEHSAFLILPQEGSPKTTSRGLFYASAGKPWAGGDSICGVTLL